MQVPEKIVRLCSCDGQVYVMEPKVLEMCATIRSILRGKTAFKNGLGGLFSIDNGFVVLKSEGKILASIVKHTQEEIYLSFPDVKAEVLERVFEYCRYQGLEHTERERRAWEAEYVQVKQGLLCEVASAAYYLDIKPLVNLTSRAIASQISTKTSEELRETFSNVNCDLYVPMFATRCRLHRKMIQKKSAKEPKNDVTLENGMNVPAHPIPTTCSHCHCHVECPAPPPPPTQPLPPSSHPSQAQVHPQTTQQYPHPHPQSHPQNQNQTQNQSNQNQAPTQPYDTRSLDELLQFIGDDEGKKKNNKKKPKKPKKKDNKEKEASPRLQNQTKNNESSDKRSLSQSQSSDDYESSEELSPEVQAEIDREVEEFRLRLESISSQRNMPKIVLPSSISASLSSLQVY